ncbi:MAG: FAD-binding protein [Planctomycetia bacterium]|nr:FAD-binding protein [Planctomycetia bacterium]
MKIVVCVKIVRDEINPFDACALECALQQTDAHTVVLCMGPSGCEKELKRLSRLGVNRVLLLSDPSFAGSDTLATSRILSCALKKLKPDLVLCGRQSIDGDTAQVGPSLAATLGYSLVPYIIKFSTDICQTRSGSVPLALPAVCTIERINTLRFPSFRSKPVPIEIWNRDALEIEPERCGIAGSPTRVLQVFESKAERRSCQFIPRAELDSLVASLRNRVKETFVEDPVSLPVVRLKHVLAIGPGVVPSAESIAERVTEIPQLSALEIVDCIKAEQPDAVLWSADFWGRTIAPQVAVHLQTGLCADCTRLETDGNKLFMYRPASGDNVMAKIECRTRPAMATVRGKNHTAELVVACGHGAKARLKQIRLWSDALGALRGASRGLVDDRFAPYEEQVGLTGQSLSPHLYVAIGISGAVQHMCGVVNAAWIVAINPDKNARIFDYADYGILDYF